MSGTVRLHFTIRSRPYPVSGYFAAVYQLTKVSGTGMKVEPSVQKCRVQVSMSCQAYQSVWYGKAGCTCSRTRTLVFEQDRTLYQRVLPPACQTYKILGTGMKLVLSLPKCLLLLLFHDGTNPNQNVLFFCGACSRCYDGLFFRGFPSWLRSTLRWLGSGTYRTSSICPTVLTRLLAST